MQPFHWIGIAVGIVVYLGIGATILQSSYLVAERNAEYEGEKFKGFSSITQWQIVLGWPLIAVALLVVLVALVLLALLLLGTVLSLVVVVLVLFSPYGFMEMIASLFRENEKRQQADRESTKKQMK